MRTLCLVGKEACASPLLHDYLEQNDFLVYTCNSLETALQHLNSSIRFWVIDVMLPDGNGLELLKTIKCHFPDASVILTSAKCDQFDRVAGFELGCDDYVPKPFLPAELLFRLRKLQQPATTCKTDHSCLKMGPYQLNLFNRSIVYANTKIPLTSREFDIILYFLKHRGQAISRQQLLDSLWGTDSYVTDRNVDNYIKNIRRKMPLLNLETIYGYGYRYNV